MGLIDELAVGTSVDLSGYRSGFAEASKLVDDFVESAGKRTGGLRLAAPGIAGGGDVAGEIGGAILPLAGQVRSALVAAMAPLNGFAARFGAQFDVVGVALVRSLKKADQSIRFPRFQEVIASTRGFLDRNFADMEGRVGKFARSADTTLGGIAFASKLKYQFDQMRSILRGGQGPLAGIKAPTLNFDNSIRSVTTLGGATNAATRSFKALGAQVALSLGAFGLVFKAVGFLKDGIGSAVDLNETLSKTDAILGASSPAVKAFAGDLSAEFGLIKGEVLDISSSFGGLGKGLGKLGGADLSKFTNEFTQAAADLSSFANIDLEEAGKALTIGLSGEQSDVLKRLGVVTTEVAMAQYALANGIRKTGGAFTEQQKFTIRSGLIMEKLGKDGVNALGDLERTAGGTANQQRRLMGTIANLGTTIGTTLLPVVDTATSMFNSLASNASAAFERNRPAIDGFVSSFAHGMDVAWEAAGTLLPVVIGIGSTFLEAFSAGGSAVASFLPTFGQVVDGVKAGLVTVHIFVEEIIASLANLFGGETGAMLGGFATTVGTWLVGAFDALGFAVRNAGDLIEIAFVTAGAYVNQFLDTIALIPTNLGRIAEWFSNDWGHIMASPIITLGELIKALGASLWEFAKDPFGGVQFDGSKILDDFKQVTAKFPEMMTAGMADIGPDLERAYDRINGREADFSARMGPKFEAPAMAKPGAPAIGVAPPSMAPAEDAKKEKDVKFAGAAELGSKDAYEAIARGIAGGGPMNAVAKIGKDQLGVLREIKGVLKSAPGPGGISQLVVAKF